jgi:hypothetical protein
MKLINFLLLTLTLSNLAWAQARPSGLLKCLGKEEEALHKAKVTNVNYYLNQRMIESIITLKYASIKPVYLEKICTDSWPSFALIYHVLQSGSKIFEVSSHLSDLHQRMAHKLIKELEQELPAIISELIGMIQKNAPHAHCLKNEIPKLDIYFQKKQFLQTEISILNELRKDNLGVDILTQLKDYPSLFKRCQKSATAKKK